MPVFRETARIKWSRSSRNIKDARTAGVHFTIIPGFFEDTCTIILWTFFYRWYGFGSAKEKFRNEKAELQFLSVLHIRLGRQALQPCFDRLLYEIRIKNEEGLLHICNIQ